MSDRTKRFIRNAALQFLLLVAVVGAFLVVVGALGLLRNRSCDRLEAERVSHLEPGHDTPGPGNVYIRGFGTERSEYTEYQEAVSALANAGC